MRDHRRDLKREASGEGTSQDQPKRARRESLRFTGLNPETWGHASQSSEVSSQKSGADPLLKPEQKRPDESSSGRFSQITEKIHSEVQKHMEKLIASPEDFLSDELRAIHQKLINSLSAEEQVKQYIIEERKDLLNNTAYCPFDKQRAMHQKWIDSLPEKYQEEQHIYLINEERENLLIDTEELDLEERRDDHHTWVRLLPEKYQQEQHIYLINKERESLLNQTKNLSINQQRQIHQTWVDLLPQEFQEDQSLLLHYSERNYLFNQTRSRPFEERQAIYQNWSDSLPPEYQDRQRPSFIDSEIQLFFHEMRNHSRNERQVRGLAWFTSFPQAERPQILQRLQEHTQSIPQHLVEQFEREEQNRQRHLERVQDIVREENLSIDVPDHSKEEWSNFAANLIIEYEEKHGLGSSRVLGDILQGGTQEAASWNEIRNSNEYKDLMSWVLRSWRDHSKYKDHNNI